MCFMATIFYFKENIFAYRFKDRDRDDSIGYKQPEWFRQNTSGSL